MYRCSQCGKNNNFVNQCGCDPNNMPTVVPATDWKARYEEQVVLTYELKENRTKLCRLLDRVQCFCPVPIQDEIRQAIRWASECQSMEDLSASGGIVD